MGLKKFGALLIVTFLCITNSDAWARKWKPNPYEVAQDYLLIDHGISAQEKVLIFWFAPEYFPDTPQTSALRNMLQDYMMVGVIHFTVSDLGEFEMNNSTELEVELPNSVILNPLSESNLPPLVTSLPDVLKKIIAGGMGKVGSGLKVFIYDGKQIDRCSSGIIKINYLAERYEFQTPLPGCK